MRASPEDEENLLKLAESENIVLIPCVLDGKPVKVIAHATKLKKDNEFDSVAVPIAILLDQSTAERLMPPDGVIIENTKP